MADAVEPKPLGIHHDCYYATDPRVNKELSESLRRKNCVIAGAGRGVGRACAQFFAHASAHSITLLALELDELEETARLCREINPQIDILLETLDVRDAPAVESILERVDQAFGNVDVLLMNAGRPPQWLNTAESDPQIWWDTVAVSLQGAFNFSRFALPIMQRNSGGCIIFTSSAAAHSLGAGGSYTIGKLGMIRLAEIIHRENYNAHGIRAFAYHPGCIQTRFYWDFHDKASGKPARENAYVAEGVANEDRSADAAVNAFKDVAWDTPELAAGLVTAVAAGKLDFMSGRYLDASVHIDTYIKNKDSIKEHDLHRVRLHSGPNEHIPTLKY